MGPRQRETAALVLVQGVGRRPEALHRVAALAGTVIVTIRELPGMNVSMASRAVLEAGDGQRLTDFVALPAVEPEMPPTQRIARAFVIESVSAHLAPPAGEVTAGAGHA